MTELTQLLQHFFHKSPEGYHGIAARAYIDVGYLHRLVNGVKHNPGRDTVIRIGLGMRLNVAEVDELLLAAGHAPLVRFAYPQYPQKGGVDVAKQTRQAV